MIYELNKYFPNELINYIIIPYIDEYRTHYDWVVREINIKILHINLEHIFTPGDKKYGYQFFYSLPLLPDDIKKIKAKFIIKPYGNNKFWLSVSYLRFINQIKSYKYNGNKKIYTLCI